MDNLKKAIEYYQAKKYKESYALFKAMDESGESTYYMGLHFLHGHGVKQNDDKAFAFFKKSWENLYPEGIYMLGLSYEKGIGVKKDVQQAFKLYQAARESNQALLKLAKIYEEGQLVEKDLVKAIKLYNLLQKEGNAYAMYKIGYFYTTGTGLKKNLKSGYQWLQKALGKNEPLAINYFRMIGSKPSTDTRTSNDVLNQAKSAIQRKDKEYALSYLKVCIAEKSVEALMILVDLYLDGQLFEKDESKAFELLLKHKDIEDGFIYYRIGQFYEEGIGVVSSYYKASLFYQKAKDLSYEPAKNALMELRGY